MNDHLEALTRLSKALRLAIEELVDDYKAVKEALRRDGKWGDKDERRARLERRAHLHNQLARLVPRARHLRIHLQQVTTGVSDLPLERTAAPLIAVLLGEFAMAENPLPSSYAVWRLPLEGSLIADQAFDLIALRDTVSPTLWAAQQRDHRVLYRLAGSTLRELRHSWLGQTALQTIEQQDHRSHQEKVAAFEELRACLRATLTASEYTLLQEFGGRF